MPFRHRGLGLVCAAYALGALACAPGGAGASAGGAGGASATGGATATGGTIATGGTTASGGAQTTGGTSSSPTTAGSGGTLLGGVGSGGATTGGGTGAGSTGRDAGTSGGQSGSGGAAGRDATVEVRADGGGDGGAQDTRQPNALDATVEARQVDAGSATCTLGGSATAQTPTVYVIGDSTASVYGSSLAPRMGWAQPLPDFFAAACATIADRALSGRSSKSFYDEGAWAPIKNALRKGDYVLIQFGHNDEKTDDAARGTDPYTTFQQYLSIYVDDALAKGATPILLTPINRNNWSGSTLRDTHGDYPPAMRDLAGKKRVALVDATVLTKAYFERIGAAATAKLFLILAAGESPNYPDGVTDNTHLQEKGARTIAQMVLAELYRQGLPPGTLAKAVPLAP